MNGLRVGVLLGQQNTTFEDYAEAVQRVEALGVDTIWDWDHFFPPYEERPPQGSHFEGWTLLAAMAMLTSRAEIGCMVTSVGYRNPSLLSNMAKTVDHISGGRLILGIGAGWFEYEYREYGFRFGTAKERLEILGKALPIIQKRLHTDEPLPLRPIPVLIGGGGEKITLRLVAEYADIWNGFGPPEEYLRKAQVLDDWCDQVGRDPAEIERSVLISPPEMNQLDKFVEAGATHLILELVPPYNIDMAELIVRWRDTR